MTKTSTSSQSLINLKALLYLMSNDKQSRVDEDLPSQKNEGKTSEEKPVPKESFQSDFQPDVIMIKVINPVGGRKE